jgi:phosphatidylglycerol:prolipoprotein diacylglycerol transferase
MMLLGVTAAVGLAVRRARQMGVDPELIYSLALWLFVAGIAGARAFHVIEYWDESYRKETVLETVKAVINIPNGGLVVFGSVFGGAVAFVVFAMRRRIPMLALGDLIAPSLMLALAIGRIGCLLHGCCYGGECQLPWRVTFPEGSPPYYDQLLRGRLAGLVLEESTDRGVTVQSVDADSLAARAGFQQGEVIRSISGQETPTLEKVREALASGGEGPLGVATSAGNRLLPALTERSRSLPVHPTQIYSALDALLLCLFLLAYYPSRRRDGEVLALMLTIHPVMRFLLEQIRIDERGVLGTSLSISQVVSLGLLVGAAALWAYIVRRPTGSVLPVMTGQ